MIHSERVEPSDGIDILALARTLWVRRRAVAFGTITVTFLGVLYALFATPVYRAQGIIAPRESEQAGGASRILSQLGGAAALAGSQMGIGSNGLTKLETILKSHEVAEAVIRNHNLLPALFYKKWNAETRTWKVKNPKKIPTVRFGVEHMLINVLSVGVNEKKGIVTVGASVHDSVLAKRIVDAYLFELGDKIRRDVMKDAEMNREFLQEQLMHTSDPVVVEKIQGMIAFEIEKSMLVSYQAFEILAKPVVPFERSKPKRKIIVGLALMLGFLGSCTVILAWGRFKSLKASVMGVRT